LSESYLHISLPKYLQKFRDPVSGLLHLAGAVFGALGMCFLVGRASHSGSAMPVLAGFVFGSTLVMLYAASAFYHLLDVSPHARVYFRKLDHSMIYFLIAGSYTPFCLLALPQPLGRILLAVVWGFAALGLCLSLFWLSAPRWLTTAIYLFMGWLILFAIKPLMASVSAPIFSWLVAGGIFYTVGAIIYALKWPDPLPPHFGHHEIWHLFVLAGSGSHFVSISMLL